MNEETRCRRVATARALHKRPRRAAVAVILLGAAMVLRSTAMSAEGGGAATGELGVDDTRAVLGRWVETRRIISQEKRDWALGKEMLSDRIELVQQEIDALRAKMAEAQKSIIEADRQREELVAKNEKLKQASADLADTATKLESRTRDLLARLPDAVQSRVKPLSDSFPDPGKKTEMSMGMRFQNVVGLLNELNKADHEITVAPETQTLPDGNRAEVTTVYVGLGQGYYVGANGAASGVGTAGDGAWTWTPNDAIAPQVAQAVAILADEQVAAFVRLPVTIK